MKWPWYSDVQFDSEFDIEGEEVYDIDRDYDNETCISYYDKNGGNVECFMLTTIDKHDDYIKRYRTKLFLESQCINNEKDPNKYCVTFKQSLLWALIHDIIAHQATAFALYKVPLFIQFHDYTSAHAWKRNGT